MNELNKEVKGRAMTYIGTAFGLVAGLAWNEAITERINVLFPISKDSVWIKFIYAIILTIAVVIVIKQLEKFANKETGNKEQGS
jgi:hypothetical protein